MSLHIAIRRSSKLLLYSNSSPVATLAGRSFSTKPSTNDLEKPVLKDNILPVRLNVASYIFFLLDSPVF
jgi:hypothetical protein